MHRYWIAPALAAAALAVGACARNPRAAREAASAAPPPPRYVVALLDGSGSYDYVDRGRELLATLVRRLPPGSVIAVRWITARSYGPEAAIVTARLPERPPSGPVNPFDRRARLARRAFLKRLATERERIVRAITTAPFPNARRTDIIGALAAAGERLAGAPSGFERELVVFSDLEDNAGLDEGTVGRLEGVAVRLLAYERVDPRTASRWIGFFLDRGARGVWAADPDEPLELARRVAPAGSGGATRGPSSGR